MDELHPEQVEREVSRLRANLAVEVDVPLGMLSRLDAGVRRAPAGSSELSWESRAVVACVVWAILQSAVPGLTLGAVAAFAALYAVAVRSETSPA